MMVVRVHGEVLARCNAAHPLEDLWRLVQDEPELIEEIEGGIKVVFEVGAKKENGEWWWDPMGEITLGFTESASPLPAPSPVLPDAED